MTEGLEKEIKLLVGEAELIGEYKAKDKSYDVIPALDKITGKLKSILHQKLSEKVVGQDVPGILQELNIELWKGLEASTYARRDSRMALVDLTELKGFIVDLLNEEKASQRKIIAEMFGVKE